jgi:hypothetical protein
MMPELSRHTLLVGVALTGAALGGQPRFLSTDATAQYCLAAIQRLALIGDHLP